MKVLANDGISQSGIDALKSKGWGQQAEILTFLVSKSKKIYEVSVNYNARTYNDGKKIRYNKKTQKEI